MLNIQFNKDDSEKRHQCIGVKDGDWVIFKCNECSYTRKMNLKTGKSSTKGGDWEILHEGSFASITDEPTYPMENSQN